MLDEETVEGVRPEQHLESAARTDYWLEPGKVPNGNRRPVEVCEFAQMLRVWRARSSQSTALFSESLVQSRRSLVRESLLAPTRAGIPSREARPTAGVSRPTWRVIHS